MAKDFGRIKGAAVPHVETAAAALHRGRQFTAETGETPARAVERLRSEAALPRIEGTTEPLDQIALQVGFGGRERMRRVCLRIYGQTPQALRRKGRALA